jgi:hypothetical protein
MAASCSRVTSATDAQAVNLQAVEPLGQFDLAGKVEGELP